jgi:hypothetical protein
MADVEKKECLCRELFEKLYFPMSLNSYSTITYYGQHGEVSDMRYKYRTEMLPPILYLGACMMAGCRYMCCGKGCHAFFVAGAVPVNVFYLQDPFGVNTLQKRH